MAGGGTVGVLGLDGGVVGGTVGGTVAGAGVVAPTWRTTHFDWAPTPGIPSNIALPAKNRETFI